MLIQFLNFAGRSKEVQVTAPNLVWAKSHDREGRKRAHAREVPLCKCHPTADGHQSRVSTPTKWETQEGNECSCGHKYCAERRGRSTIGDVATTTAEVTSRNSRIPSFTFSRSSLSRLFLLILDVLRGPFLHTVSRTTTLFFVHLHLIGSATSHAIPVPNDRPSSTLPLPGTISYSTFNDLVQSSPFSFSPLSHQSHELCPLSFLIYFSSFRLTLRCHLDPQSTLALPEFFFY